MKIDRLTKILLGIIALNLTLLTLSRLNIIPSAKAEQKTNRQIQNLQTEMNYGLVPLNEDGSVNVRLTPSSIIDVNISGVETNKSLNVNLDKIGGGYLTTGGPVPVRIEEK